MSSDVYRQYLQEIADEEAPPVRKQRGAPAKTSRTAVVATLVEPGDDTEGGFNPTFHASRHERVWILEYLGPFYADQEITDVLRQVKGGKEATVYCCRAHELHGGGLVAAKVYRPRMFRNLRNDAIYRAGRTVLDNEGKAARGSREARAMAKGTDFGQEMRHLSWLGNEFGTLERLHAAGLDVPAPVAVNDNAILMEYFGDENQAAPALHGVHLEGAEPRQVFDRLLDQIGGMLDQERIHGDLSAHNILYWDGVARIIDFPQAVSPLENPHAYALFARDVERVCGYFARYGLTPNPRTLAADLWRAHLPDPITDDIRLK